MRACPPPTLGGHEGTPHESMCTWCKQQQTMNNDFLLNSTRTLTTQYNSQTHFCSASLFLKEMELWEHEYKLLFIASLLHPHSPVLVAPCNTLSWHELLDLSAGGRRRAIYFLTCKSELVRDPHTSPLVWIDLYVGAMIWTELSVQCRKLDGESFFYSRKRILANVGIYQYLLFLHYFLT